LKPRRLRSFDSASDSAVLAGTVLGLRWRLTKGFPPTNDQA